MEQYSLLVVLYNFGQNYKFEEGKCTFKEYLKFLNRLYDITLEQFGLVL